MYDDAWYNAFVPSRSSRRPARRPSLLDPSNAEEADVDNIELERPIGASSVQSIGPPNATVARRAKSYSDFHHASRKTNLNINGLDKDQGNSSPAIKSRLGLEEWYDGFAEPLAEYSHERYQLYLDQLRMSRQHLDSLLEDTETNLKLLSKLSASFEAVEIQTSSFQSHCEGLLSEQKRLTGLANNVAENLQYYNLLDPMTRRLNAPGAGHLVQGADFSQMLSNLDKCLDFMQTHPHHREASIYQSRYRLLLTRALTLIRVHFTNTLREIAADVSKRIADRQLNDTTMSALLYAKFRVGATELKQLGLEIQKRASPPPQAEPGAQGEYQSLMNELYQSYSAARGRLIVPLVRRKLADIASSPTTSKDLVAFARSSVGYIRGICLDEYDLWHEWFDGDGGLYEFLEAMVEPLFDYLRPRTIRETQLAKLCDMCSLVQVRYMDEQDDDSEPIESARLDFACLIRGALEDAQTRLVFLALAFLRDEIERFKPKPADLENAGRTSRVPLSGMRNKAPSLPVRKPSSSETPQSPHTPTPKTPLVVEEEDADPLDLKWRYAAGAPSQEWYPTLRKAIWLLSRIYRLVNSTVFDDLAHQIVHQTTLSLQKAASTLSSKTKPPTDTQLFLLKQLLILKQQIVAFDIEFVTPELNVDFSNVTNTFWELRERGGLFNPANLLRLVGGGLLPRVVENMLDAKAELDGRLRTVINDFTTGHAARMTAAIAPAAAAKPDFDAAVAVQATRSAVEEEVRALRAKLDEYLDDVRIKETLVGAVEDRALQMYEEFFERHVSRVLLQSSNGKGTPAVVVSKKGKGREDGVWDPDTFADWTAGVFGVGRVGLGLDGDGDEEGEGGDRSLMGRG